MPIKLLKQNLEYFKYTNNIIKSVEIDNRFNDIVNYLNNEIIYKLNNLNKDIIVGSLLQTDINSILKSNNDVGYKWKKIDNDDFADKSINIKKLNYKVINNSIFIADDYGNIKLLKNQNMKDNTIVCINNKINFDRIKVEHMLSTSYISGDKISYNTIDSYNLANIKNTLFDSIIVGKFIKNKSILSKHIKNGSIDQTCFNNETINLLYYKIWSSIIPKQYINLNSTGNKNIINSWDRNLLSRLFGYSIPFSKFKIPITKFSKFYIKNIIKLYTNEARETDLSLTDPNGKKVGAEKIYYFSQTSFKPDSLNANRLICWFNKQNNDDKCYNINDILAEDTITINKLTPAIQAKIN